MIVLQPWSYSFGVHRFWCVLVRLWIIVSNQYVHFKLVTGYIFISFYVYHRSCWGKLFARKNSNKRIIDFWNANKSVISSFCGHKWFQKRILSKIQHGYQITKKSWSNSHNKKKVENLLVPLNYQYILVKSLLCSIIVNKVPLA